MTSVFNLIQSKLGTPWSYDPAVYLPTGPFSVELDHYHLEGMKELSTGFSWSGNRLSGDMPDVAEISVPILTNGTTQSLHLVNTDLDVARRYTGSLNSATRYGYGLTALPGCYELPYFERFGQPSDINLPWDKVCRNAARQIFERFGDHLFLAMSGGIDSELMAWFFYMEGIPFTPFIALYQSEDTGEIHNLYDVNNAIEWCSKVGKTPIIRSLDLVREVADKRHLEYLKDINFTIPHIFSHMWMIETIHRDYGGVFVGASDQTELRFNEHGELTVGFNSLDVGLPGPAWAELKGIPTVYGFFNYDPDQIITYLRIPEVHQTTKLDYAWKHYISQTYGCTFLSMRNQKYTGFEGFKRELFIRGIDNDELIIEMIEMIDWTTMPKSHYAYPVRRVLERKRFDEVCLMKMSPRDFMVSGYYSTDPSYKFGGTRRENLRVPPLGQKL